MNLKNSTIGIWGFGRVGKAAASFFTRREARVIVYDDNLAHLANIPYLTAPSIEALFNAADYVLPSPGIATTPYRTRYPGQWLTEVDLFHQFFTKPVIAITGSIGKTTVTHLLTALLKQHGHAVMAAGNIGTPLLEIIDTQSSLDMAVVELSSFQLEFATLFAPRLAIITNVYPNHLDRHGTMEHYFAAKASIIRQQTKDHMVLAPYTLYKEIVAMRPKSSLAFFAGECSKTPCPFPLFCINTKNNEFHLHNSRTSIPLSVFPPITFAENWLMVWAALTLLDVPYPTAITVEAMAHRLEKVADIDDIIFYNDSKSTTMNSTLAAIEQFKTRRILLFLGGLSKGIDRTPLIKALQSYRVSVFCFGKEAAHLKSLCDEHAINAALFTTLEDAFTATTNAMQPHDCILFSPSGSSYDLFKNYEERGNTFKQLVLAYKNNRS